MVGLQWKAVRMEELKERLRELGLSIRRVSWALGVPRWRLKKVLRGELEDPVLEEALAVVLHVEGSGRGNRKGTQKTPEEVKR